MQDKPKERVKLDEIVEVKVDVEVKVEEDNTIAKPEDYNLVNMIKFEEVPK